MNAVATFVAAWQAALAAEEQAAFGYALLGPRLPAADQDLARTCAAAHETLRTATQEGLAAAGSAPVAPQADYPGLYPVRSAGAARSLAVRLEQDCASAWRALYLAAASTTGTSATARRADAQSALDAATQRAVHWRVLAGTSPATVPFPGT